MKLGLERPSAGFSAAGMGDIGRGVIGSDGVVAGIGGEVAMGGAASGVVMGGEVACGVDIDGVDTGDVDMAWLGVGAAAGLRLRVPL